MTESSKMFKKYIKCDNTIFFTSNVLISGNNFFNRLHKVIDAYLMDLF